MTFLVNLLILFVFALIAVAILGLIAGFSPTLYITQVTLSSKSAKLRQYTYFLMAGVLAAVVLLLILFQTLNLGTMIDIIDSTANALLVSVIFNLIIGVLFIIAGIHYIRKKDVDKAYKPATQKVKSVGSSSAMFGLGFVKTLVSISGVTAIYIGGNIIGSTASTFVEHIIYTLVFLAATIAPFFAVLRLLQRNPERLTSLVERLKSSLKKFNYRLIIGIIAIILGSAIVIFNVMMTIFY